MANPTLFQLATTTVGSGGVSSVTFSNIPQVYTDLVVKISARSNSTAGGGTSDEIVLDINATGSGQSDKRLAGDGATAFSDAISNNVGIFGTSIAGAGDTSNTFGSAEFYIPNYTNTTTYKSTSSEGVSENNAGGQYSVSTSMVAGINNSTAAVTSLLFKLRNGTSIVQYSTFTLYGVRNY